MRPPARILRYTEPWTLIALVFVAFSGLALFASQTSIYLVNLIFPLKMYVLLAALIYNFTIHRKVATMQNPLACLKQGSGDRIPAAVGVGRVWRDFHRFPGVEAIRREHRSLHPEHRLSHASSANRCWRTRSSCRIHLTCIALFGGMILMTNLRLLGLTFKSLTITEMVTSFRPWKRAGGVIMIATGLLLASL